MADDELDLAAIVAAVQGPEAAEPEPRDSEAEDEDEGPLRADECMYCRGKLIVPRQEELVCDTCHYTDLTFEERIEIVGNEVDELVKSGLNDLFVYEAKVAAIVETAVILAKSRDERLVRQYARGLLDGFRHGSQLEPKEFPVESYQEYAKTAKVWGD